MTEDVVIDCTAIDRMAEEAARINRENRREIWRLQREACVLRCIAQVRYDMATQACDTRRAIQDSTREVLGFLTQDKISSLQAENQALKFAASQQAQNAFITANQEAQTAELIRRLGRDCPIPAYWVQPPTPIVPPTCGGCY